LPTMRSRSNERQFAVYKGFLQRRGIRIRSARDYLLFVKRSGVDPEARRALMVGTRQWT